MMRLELILLIAAVCTNCIQAQTKPVFDLSKLFGSRSNDPLVKLLDRHLPEIQEMIDQTKTNCLLKLKMPLKQRSLIRESNPTEKEKCLIECVLKGIDVMDSTNRLNLRRVEQITGLVTDDNKLAIAVSSSMAQNCNRMILTQKPCEAAHQLNQCIGRQMERNNVRLNW